jgi:hypothetical protein
MVNELIAANEDEQKIAPIHCYGKAESPGV